MTEWARILIAVALVIGLVALLILSYVLNKRTKKPEGCVEINEHCPSCNVEGCPTRSASYEDNNLKGEE